MADPARPGIDDLDLRVDTSGERREVESFGRPYLGIDQGDPAAAWLTHVLGHDSRLVRVPPEHHRVTTGRTPGTSGYADSTALFVLSRATLDLLKERLAARGPPVPMNHFRPNIVVDGWDEPHTEDRAHRIRIGETEFGYAKIAIRCAVTMVGRKAGPEPLRTLAGYRRAARAEWRSAPSTPCSGPAGWRSVTWWTSPRGWRARVSVGRVGFVRAPLRRRGGGPRPPWPGGR
ncbi:MOSC domain-containing protein [Nonomuraea phyllanthi]|uniref:MOSC domain-containing protein n=1 Tax=Nonomuraea phyllanthi TaxID=2219224 RepID=UPI001D01026A|nr:MOSC domain-containing protein [Nonomuraea phyllanthi]